MDVPNPGGDSFFIVNFFAADSGARLNISNSTPALIVQMRPGDRASVATLDGSSWDWYLFGAASSGNISL
jgi:hypothetical protein